MVDAITSATTTTQPRPAGFSGASAGADFQTFLTMLTAQLKNQDPLNPMESTDFAIQLATFAGVEQQALSNRFLEQMVGQSGGGGIAGWIGKEARTTAPVWFGDRAVTLDVAPHALADSVQLVTRDANGREITREEIGPGSGQVDWMGRTEDGGTLHQGAYSFTLESRRAGELIAETRVPAYARIVEAQFDSAGGRVVFEGGGSAPAGEVTALRDPA
ncbi:flagellar basal body rod modification protein [Paracoccus aestuarii]|uniref:Basal-body rod modification protein FlgD n=1 Tax=Paracoccus aestuarii TaxID=453842 RepID=A0A418ZP59_9RHOB|nr:flagellar hook capping FlgD N-terminal domain-containing protein [Paracoccus aestuarii]RJK94510.1 flagellar basal body rod modification protein [Paracoccus aestuarii]WCQ99498.1 flagellar basal body rod modification protein [Paracoccus aestuarii]